MSTDVSDNKDLYYKTLACGIRIYLITVCTKMHPMLEYLQKTCESYDIGLNLFAMNDPRFQTWGQNFGVKLECLQQFCDRMVVLQEQEEQSVPDDALFIFIDAFDVLLVRDLETFYQTYRQFQSDIVYSGEVYCHPDRERASQYPAGGTYRFLNSGTFCGRIVTMQQMMSLQTYTIAEDDQRYHTDLYFKHRDQPSSFNKHKCIIDTEAQLFMCLAGSAVDDLGVEVKQLVNTRTETQPCILHFNTCAHLLPRTFDIWKNLPAYVQEQTRWTTMLRSRKRKGFPSVAQTTNNKTIKQ